MEAHVFVISYGTWDCAYVARSVEEAILFFRGDASAPIVDPSMVVSVEELPILEGRTAEESAIVYNGGVLDQE